MAGTPTVADLVAAWAPDHAGHAQKVVDSTVSTGAIALLCSCGVGLTVPAALKAISKAKDKESHGS